MSSYYKICSCSSSPPSQMVLNFQPLPYFDTWSRFPETAATTRTGGKPTFQAILEDHAAWLWIGAFGYVQLRHQLLQLLASHTHLDSHTVCWCFVFTSLILNLVHPFVPSHPISHFPYQALILPSVRRQICEYTMHIPVLLFFFQFGDLISGVLFDSGLIGPSQLTCSDTMFKF